MNYSTYFTRGQKVFLINTSADRDKSLFEASPHITTAKTTVVMRPATRCSMGICIP